MSWFHTHTHTLTCTHVYRNTLFPGYFQNNRAFSNIFLSPASFQSTYYKIEVRRSWDYLGIGVPGCPSGWYLSFFSISHCMTSDFPGGSAVKNMLPANVWHRGSIIGLARSPGNGNGNHCSILAWEITWTEEPGGLRVGLDLATEQQLCDPLCLFNLMTAMLSTHDRAPHSTPPLTYLARALFIFTLRSHVSLGFWWLDSLHQCPPFLSGYPIWRA